MERFEVNDRQDTLEALRSGDAEEFSRLSEGYRNELRAFCYRMSGSIEDAEDLVQETFLRAWRRRESYEGRASLRSWLYKIATNASLDALRRLPRRTLTLEDEETTILAPEHGALDEDPAWIQPIPDAWLAPSSASPEARYSSYESVSLAFLVALQILPPRQRTVLIFADVLDWPMAEIADTLGITLTAATSLLHRARVTLKERNAGGKLDRSRMIFPTDQTRQALERYAQAWEAADVEGILALLADDAVFPMPPMRLVIRGKQAMARFYGENLFNGDARGRWKLVPIQANGLAGFAFYRLDEGTRRHQAHVLQVLSVREGLVRNATTFVAPNLFKHFGLPETL